MLTVANQFSTEVVLATASPSAGLGISLGWSASYVLIRNQAAVPIHWTLTSTAAATTDDPELPAGKDVTIVGVPTYKIGISTTSTTTSTGLDGHRVLIAAFGW